MKEQEQEEEHQQERGGKGKMKGDGGGGGGEAQKKRRRGMEAKKVVKGRGLENHEIGTHELEILFLGVSILTAFRRRLTPLRPCPR